MLQGSYHEKGFEKRSLVLLRDVLKVVKEAQILANILLWVYKVKSSI